MDGTAYFMNTETYDNTRIPVVSVEDEVEIHPWKLRCKSILRIQKWSVWQYHSYWVVVTETAIYQG